MLPFIIATTDMNGYYNNKKRKQRQQESSYTILVEGIECQFCQETACNILRDTFMAHDITLDKEGDTTTITCLMPTHNLHLQNMWKKFEQEDFEIQKLKGNFVGEFCIMERKPTFKLKNEALYLFITHAGLSEAFLSTCGEPKKIYGAVTWKKETKIFELSYKDYEK